MPTDLSTIADPRFILVAWASGTLLAAGWVTRSNVVGVGFTWLAVATSILIGVARAMANGGTWAFFGLLAAALGAIVSSKKRRAGWLVMVGGLALLADGASLGGWLPALSASLALGGVTGEMLLGHWYLIDPRLPRRALRLLAIAGGLGLLLDGLVIASTGELSGTGATLAYWLLLFSSIVLMAGVLGALRYPAYSGVMAATGLSYLAVLTSLGAVFMGRALIAGVGPFAT